ncbi:MAG: type II toxin-antitoxin system RelE family toxin [Pseudorhizobium sp.]
MYLEDRLATHENPRELGTALKGDALGLYWRYRVGDYRIICDIQDQRLVVLVIDVGHRREVCR